MKKEGEISGYKTIFKGTAIFGGTQAFQAMVALIRGKFIAILLGATGMGINSLFSSAILPIQQFASLGMNLSLVKEISGAEDEDRKKQVVSVGNRLFFIAGLIGAFICLVLSPLLSLNTFGNYNNTLGFCFLSLMVFFGVVSGGNYSILQGLHDVKRISRATFIAGIVSLLICVPLYYFFGDGGIIPALIIMPFTSFLYYKFSIRKHYANLDRIKLKEHSPLIKRLLITGFILMIGALIGNLVNYLINVFIRDFGTIDNVGLFQAANSITNQYAMLVFAAMAADFFPRLVKVSADNTHLREIVNRQISIVILIISPLSCIVIALAPFVIRILLAESFEIIVPLLKWFALAIILKASSYPLGYVTFAKDNRRAFFLLEGILGNIIYLGGMCTGYYLYGLEGLGIAMMVIYATMNIVYYIVNKKLYQFTHEGRNILLILFGLIAGSSTFIASECENVTWSISLTAAICTLITSIYAFILVRLIKGGR